MATSRKLKRLSDAYRIDGFRPREALRGVFGDRMARVVTLVRRSKKRPARDVVDSARSTIAGCVAFEICRAAMYGSTSNSKFVGSAVDAMAA
jgi:hypothetical protein